MLSWREKNGKKAVNLFIVGKLGRGNLASSESEYGDPAYRLELIIDEETTMAIQNILKDGPLNGLDDVRSPVLGNSAIFSAKLKICEELTPLNSESTIPFRFSLTEGRWK